MLLKTESLTGDQRDWLINYSINVPPEDMTKIIKIIQAGFLQIRGGSMTVHFDGTGTLRKIEKNYIEEH